MEVPGDAGTGFASGASVRLRVAGALISTVAGFLVLGACRSGPSFDDYRQLVRGRAGADAVDCGVTRLHHDRAAAVSCSVAALEGGSPFFVVFQVRGIDTQRFCALPVDREGRAVRAEWDSDVYGGGNPFMTKASSGVVACDHPRVVDEEMPGQCSDGAQDEEA